MKNLIIFFILLFSVSLFAQRVDLIVPTFHASSIKRIVVSPDKSLVATCSFDNAVKVWTYPDLKLLKEYTIIYPKDVNFSPDGNILAVMGKEVTLIDTKTLAIIKTTKGYGNAIFGEDSNTMYILDYKHEDSNFKLFNYTISTGNREEIASIERVKRYQSENRVNSYDMYLSPDKNKILLTDAGGYTHLINLKTKEVKTTKNGGIYFITDANLLSASFASNYKSGTFTVKNMEGEEIWSKTLDFEPLGTNSFNGTIDIDREKKILYIMTREGFIYGNYETGNLQHIKVDNIGNLSSFTIVDDNTILTPENKTFKLIKIRRSNFSKEEGVNNESIMSADNVVASPKYGTFIISAPITFTIKDKQIALQPNGLKVSTLSSNSNKYDPNNTKTVENSKGTIKARYDLSMITVTNTTTRQSIKITQNKYEIRSIAFVADDFIVSTALDNRIKLWDAISGNFLGNIYVFQTSDEWAFVAADGRFDASEKALKSMYYTKGREIIPLEQLYEGFYTPNLLGQILGRRLSPPPAIIIDDIKSPPSVTLKYEQGTRNLTVEDDQTVEIIKTTAVSAKIIVNATAPNDKVAELRLYHNGKLITNKSRNLTVEDDVSNNAFNKVYEIELLPGTNTFKAVALNSQRTESSPAMLTVNLEGEKAKPKTGGIQLHMVVVGINEYKNPKYNLNYAVADATAFQNAIKNGMSKITSKVNVTFIKNSEANRDNIYTKLQEIANNANPQDVFIFYYAGHGMMSEEANPDFYLVPHDVTQIYGDDGGIKKKGISATELKLLASKIPAQKQLYVLDACQSAGALTSVASRGAGEEKAIAQLARSTGTHWLTASGSQQFATEFDQLGHGIFTYVFLDALKGKADSGDGRITVNEIKAYLESQVPELSQKYNGSPQYPASFGFGQDFPVGVKN